MPWVLGTLFCVAELLSPTAASLSYLSMEGILNSIISISFDYIYIYIATFVHAGCMAEAIGFSSHITLYSE